MPAAHYPTTPKHHVVCQCLPRSSRQLQQEQDTATETHSTKLKLAAAWAGSNLG